MDCGFLLNLVITNCVSAIKLFPCKDESLLITRNTFLVLDLCLQNINAVRRFNFSSDGLASECLNKYLHVVFV